MIVLSAFIVAREVLLRSRIYLVISALAAPGLPQVFQVIIRRKVYKSIPSSAVMPPKTVFVQFASDRRRRRARSWPFVGAVAPVRGGCSTRAGEGVSLTASLPLGVTSLLRCTPNRSQVGVRMAGLPGNET